MDALVLMNGRRFQAPSGVGQSLPPACAAELLKDEEIFDAGNDDGLSSVKQSLAPVEPAKQVIDLTRDDNGER